MPKRKVSFAPSIRRLPSYLHIIKQAYAKGDSFIPGTIIAQELNLEPIQVRKDLAITGIMGKPKKGYPVGPLIEAIERYLGWDLRRDAVLLGAGNLGSALLGYQEFAAHGLNFLAAFDSDAAKIEKSIHGIPVYPMEELRSVIRRLDIEVAVLAVPSSYAQMAADALVDAGVAAIWNFTNVRLKLPDRVVVQKEDLSSGYAILSVMMRNRDS